MRRRRLLFLLDWGVKEARFTRTTSIARLTSIKKRFEKKMEFLCENSRERELAIFIYEVNVTDLQRTINSVVIYEKSFPHNGRTQMLT